MIDIYNVVSARVNKRVVERVSKYKQVIQFKRVADMLLKPIIPKVPQITITCNYCRVTDKPCVIRIRIRNCFKRLDVHANGAATRENRYSVIPTRSYTNRSVQSQIIARSLRFWI